MARVAASTGPGSAAYGLPSHLQSRNDFNKATTTAPFHLPIAKKLERLVFPAPNQYDVCIPTVHVIENSFEFCITISGVTVKKQPERGKRNCLENRAQCGT